MTESPTPESESTESPASGAEPTAEPAPASGARGWTIGAIAAVVIGVGAAVAVALWPDGEAPMPVVTPSATASAEDVESIAAPSASPEPEDPYAYLGEAVATTRGEDITVYAEAGGGDVVATMGPWSYYGLPTTLMALEEAEVDGVRWLHVSLPIQPNGSTGWIRADEVDVTSTDVQVRIYLDVHELDVLVNGEQVFTTIVAVGAPESPTPTGVYSVTDPVDFQANPSGVFGAYALGTSAFSEAVSSFWDGPPQVAMHGTNEPELLGQDVSNGCIRMSSEAVLELAELVDLGTPVIIEAGRPEV